MSELCSAQLSESEGSKMEALSKMFQRKMKGEDFCDTYLLHNSLWMACVVDGHGPTEFTGCTGIPETKTYARDLIELIRKVVIATVTMPLISNGLSACASALLPALQNAVARFIAEKDAELWETKETRQVWIGSTISLVLSRGDQFVSITAGDSPVYELAGGRQVNLINQDYPSRQDVRDAFADESPQIHRMGRLIYSLVEGAGAVQRSAFACERIPMQQHVSSEEYVQFILKMWTLFPWHISEVHSGDFLVASDGIEVFCQSGELAIPADRLALIASTPWIAVTERLRGRPLPDDLTVISTLMQDEPAPAVPVAAPAASDPVVPVWGCFALVPPS
jgi:serine/threonine protein phosphatase PrpC